jgi:hypothetical protein
MRKETKQGKKKKREKAYKLLQSNSPLDRLKGKKFLKQANKKQIGKHSKSNY